MISTQSLRDELDRYADGAINAEGLEEWIAAESWDMRRWASPGLQHFIEAIQVAFIDYSDGKLSADALQRFLLQRRAQLQSAQRVTAERITPRITQDMLTGPRTDSVAVNEALTVEPEPVSV